MNDLGSVTRSDTEHIILSCVLSLAGELPRSGIAKLLVGSHSERVAAYRLHPDYGCLAHLPRYIVMQEIDALINRGELTLDDKSRVTVKGRESSFQELKDNRGLLTT